MPVEASPPAAPSSTAPAHAPQRTGAKDKAPSGFNAILVAAADTAAPIADPTSATGTAGKPNAAADTTVGTDTNPLADNTLPDAAALLAQALQIPTDTTPPVAEANTTATDTVAIRSRPASDVRPDAPALADAPERPETGALHPSHTSKGKTDASLGDTSSSSTTNASAAHTGDSANSSHNGKEGEKPVLTAADLAKVLTAKADAAPTNANSGTPTHASGESKAHAPTVTTDLPTPTLSSTPASTGMTATAATLPASFESQLKEQVTYWISQDVQHAEMTLDGLGKDAVEVSIRMQGNEAHVAFRTDELQTREALESAGASLKDMLHRQGLQLSGVSVGTSNRGHEQSSNPKPRQGVRHTQVGAAAIAPLSTIPRTSVASGGVRTLDLFV